MYARTAAVALVAAGLFQSAGIDRVAWLRGCWRLTSPGRVVEENWMAPRGGSMIGVSRTLQDDALREYELVVVRETSLGLSYEAHPAGQPTATFEATAATDSTVVFENPAHDFPQRVGYRRAPGDSLFAWIEGTLEGRSRRVEFRYGRVACQD